MLSVRQLGGDPRPQRKIPSDFALLLSMTTLKSAYNQNHSNDINLDVNTQPARRNRIFEKNKRKKRNNQVFSAKRLVVCVEKKHPSLAVPALANSIVAKREQVICSPTPKAVPVP